MSHELESMFYIGETPWHGLGRYVGEDPIKADEAIVAAGLDWEVKLEEMNLSKDSSISIPSTYAIVRQTDNKILGVTGNKYQPIQNKEAFDFTDSLIENNSLRYHTAGSLRGGKKIWLLGKAGSFEAVPGDIVEKYLFLFTSHDRSGSAKILFTNTRVVCMNTARIAFDNAKENEIVSIRHTGNIAEKKAKAQEILGLAYLNFSKHEEFVRTIVSKQINSIKLEELMKIIIPDPPEEYRTDRILLRRENKRKNIVELFESGVGQNITSVSGTGWALYNAVTEYLNYKTPVRTANKSERRIENSILNKPQLLINTEEALLAA